MCAQVWDCNVMHPILSSSRQRILTVRWDYNGEVETTMLASSVIADANPENIQKAKIFINGLTASGGNVAVCCAGIAL